MNTEISIDVFLAIFSMIFGLIMMIIALINLTKKFEDQYDKKTKDIAIVYDDKFEREIERYIEKKKSAGEHEYEILQEELNDCKERIMIYAAEYYDWMEQSKNVKKLLRDTALYFLGGGLLGFFASVLRIYAPEFFTFVLVLGVLAFVKAFINIIYYMREESKIDDKYTEYELRRIKDW